LPKISPQLARRWPTWRQTTDTALVRFCLLLPTIFEYEQGNDGDVRRFEQQDTDLTRLARQLLDSGRLGYLRQLPLDRAVRELPG
jgi:hypothetical protein